MPDIKVTITDRDNYVGAMVRGLAHEVAGRPAVKGATKEFLSKNGFYVLPFANSDKASEFSVVIRRYLPPSLAQVVE